MNVEQPFDLYFLPSFFTWSDFMYVYNSWFAAYPAVKREDSCKLCLLWGLSGSRADYPLLFRIEKLSIGLYVFLSYVLTKFDNYASVLLAAISHHQYLCTFKPTDDILLKKWTAGLTAPD